MSCLIYNSDTVESINNITDLLWGDEVSPYRDYNREEVEPLAKHMLMCNNGRREWYTPDGQKSQLYEQLLDYFKSYDKKQQRALALAAKLYIYTPQYAALHGDWINEVDDEGNNLPEPSIDTVIDSFNGDVEQLLAEFDNIGTSHLVDYINGAYLSAAAKRDPALLREILHTDDIENLQTELEAQKNDFVLSELNTTSTQDSIEKDTDYLMGRYNLEESERDRIKGSVIAQHKIRIGAQFMCKQLEHITQKIQADLKDLYNVNQDIPDKADDINTVRRNLINGLTDRWHNPEQFAVMLSLVNSYLNGDGLVPITEAFLDAQFELLKNTQACQTFFEMSGFDIKDEHGRVDQNKVNTAFSQIKANLLNASHKYSSNKKTFSDVATSFLEVIKCICGFALNLTGLVANSPLAIIPAALTTAGVYSLVAAFSPTIGAITGVATALVLNKQLAKYYRENAAQHGFLMYRKTKKACNSIIAAIALNKQASLNDAVKSMFENKNTLSEEPTSFDQYLNATNVQHGSDLQTTLIRLGQSLDKQIKSLKSTIDVEIKDEGQIEKLQSLADLCTTALQNAEDQSTINADKFFGEYLLYADAKISESIAYMNDNILSKLKQIDDKYKGTLTKEQQQNKNKEIRELFDSVNIKQLVRFKTDVIGAYEKTLHQLRNRMYKLDLEQFRPGGTYYQLVQKTTVDKLNQAKSDFNECIDRYTKYVVHEYLGETAAKTMDDKMAGLLEQNMNAWLKHQLHDFGNIGVLNKMVLAQRDSTSPIIRMIHQKLQEIVHVTETEANSVGAQLETLRKSTRTMGSRLSFFNQLNKYCERDGNGHFTGNFISEVNRGRYLSERKQMIEDLKKSMDLIYDDSTKSILWRSDEEWLQYQKNVVYWEAGSLKKDANGNWLPPTGNNPRIHKRFLYQYYIDRMEILGKRGVEMTQDLTRQIQDIYSSCSVVIPVNGVPKAVPITSQLSRIKQDRLKELIDRKNCLGSPVEYISKRVTIGSETVNRIVEIKHKIGENEELYKRFARWNIKKREYYKQDAIPNNDTYEAVKAWYEEQIQNATTPEEELLLKDQLKDFVHDNSKYWIKDKYLKQIKTTKKFTYEQNEAYIEYIGLQKFKRCLIDRITSSNKLRTPNLAIIGSNRENIISLWKELRDIEQRIYELEKQLDFEEELLEDDPKKKFKRSDVITYSPTRMLDGEENETHRYFSDYLIKDIGMSAEQLKYGASSKTGAPMWMSLLSHETVNSNLIQMFPAATSIYYFLEEKPIGIFSETQSLMYDDQFDASSKYYYQVNSEFEDRKGERIYDNSEKYYEIEHDPVYNALLNIMDKAWENYPAFSRENRYKLPQRVASTSSIFGRVFDPTIGWGHKWSDIGSAFKQSYLDAFTFTKGDVDIQDQVITRPDGTVVETIPVRWLSNIAESSKIDTDLISSVIDFYTESVRYRERARMQPLMEALVYQIESTQHNPAQLNAIQDELSRDLYGRNVVGSGYNGRLSSKEQWMVRSSQLFRSALHSSLMSHNLLSVIKNSYDSFCNILQQVIHGKYITPKNLQHGLLNMAKEAFTLFGTMQRSKAGNLTQALMQMNSMQNNVHERFTDQNKWRLRRILDKSSSLEFEGIDYTANAVLTDAVYDSYRLMKNRKTGKWQFMNHEEAEMSYVACDTRKSTRKQGYSDWEHAKYSLRDAYYMDKHGVARLRDKLVVNGETVDILEIVRPKTDSMSHRVSREIVDDEGFESTVYENRSVVFETRIRTEIRQLSSVCNGMLKNEDKTAFARNYAGSIVCAFRGWMISQAGEYYKTGTDFSDWNVGEQEQLLDDVSSRRKQAVQVDKDYEGQYNFATGTIDRGLHVKSMLSLLRQHTSTCLQALMFIKPNRFSKANANISNHDIYAICNFAAGIHMLLMTVIFTCMTLLSYLNDDDQISFEDLDFSNIENIQQEDKSMKSLMYVSMLASISERFPGLGSGAFVFNALELVKGLTVGVSLIDNAHFVLDAAIDLATYADGAYSEVINDESIEDTNAPWAQRMYDASKVLHNNTFKGSTKFERDLVRGLNVLGVDTAPFLLAADLYNVALNTARDRFGADVSNMRPSWMEDTQFWKYNLNLRKNFTEEGNKQRAKFYVTLIPASFIDDATKNNSMFAIYPNDNVHFNWNEFKKDPIKYINTDDTTTDFDDLFDK